MQKNNDEASLRFTAVVNFNSKLPQHIPDINILMVTSQQEGMGDARGRWRVEEERGAQAECMRQRAREREGVSVWERKRERGKQ